MGDRCYMKVTCRPEDTKTFEDLGFTVESETPIKCVMEDYEANWAHCEDMPENIPYYGSNGQGAEYGANKFCCDGEVLFEAPTHEDGDLVVFWNSKDDCPDEDSVERVRSYLRAKWRIRQIFSDDPLISAMAYSVFLTSHTRCGEKQITTGNERTESK